MTKTTATTTATTTTPTTTATTAGAVTSGDRSSRGLRRAAGAAALLQATTYVAGFGALAVYLGPSGYLGAQADPATSMAFMLDHQAFLYVWHLVLYLVAGAALVVLVLGVHDRLRAQTPGLAQVATAFGLTWSGLLLASGMVGLVGQRAVVELAGADTDGAVSTWSAVRVVRDALGGGIELVGALWVVLVGVAALRSGRLSRSLAGLGIAVGVAGTVTVVPQAAAAAAVFGLGFIVWFVWAGVVLLRR